ncbi:MAG: hypothetical protein U0174_12960 [Polyangiaceae bacterium]
MKTHLPLFALALTFLSLACASALELAKSNGSTRLNCPYEKVTATSLGGDQYRVEGCGKTETLTCWSGTKGKTYSQGCSGPDGGASSDAGGK